MAVRPLATVPTDGAAPADALLHPATLLALGLLVLNDHVLKAAYPGAITGKLSDLGGLAFFPILLVAAWELALVVTGRWRGPSRRVLLTALGATAAVFAVAKTLPVGAAMLASGLGWAQWLAALPLRLLGGDALPPVVSTVVVVDPTDLVALASPGAPGVDRASTCRGRAAMSHLSEMPAVTIWGFVRTLLKIALVLAILVAVFAVWAVWQISQSYPPIHPVPAPVAWVARDVLLSAEEPVVRGQLVLTARSVPTNTLRIGVNTGAPTAEPMAAPGAILAGPSVRMATDAGQGQDACFAPCELQLQPAWDCDPGDCRMVASFSLLLSVDTAGAFGPVTIGIAGGISANLEDELPPGIRASLELGGDVAPGAS